MGLEVLKLALYKRLPRRWQVRAARIATPSFTVGALGLITRDGSTVLLVRPSYRNGWLPPGGFLSKGETPLDALVREVEEELGVRMSFEPAHRVAFDRNRRAVTFVSVGLAPPESDFAIRTPELDDLGWYALDALPPMPNDFFEGMPSEDLVALEQLGRRVL